MPTAKNQKIKLCLGARGSTLSRWQAEFVKQKLEESHSNLEVDIQIIATKGDQITHIPLPEIGQKGLFTAELEEALRGGEIDFAVHSQKDLPVEDPSGLILAAILQRENPADALVSRQNFTITTLPLGARVGTSSRRRAAQLLNMRPDLQMIDLRGNVDTRIKKALDPQGPYDAIVLAYAGLARLGRLDVISEEISTDLMLPAPAQGALAIQCSISGTEGFFTPLNHPPTASSTLAERSFLQGLGGGCSLPIAAFAQINDDMLRLRGRVLSPDGKHRVDVETTGLVPNAKAIGHDLAKVALKNGAGELIS